MNMFANTLLSILAFSAVSVAISTQETTTNTTTSAAPSGTSSTGNYCSLNQVAACCGTTSSSGLIPGADCAVANLVGISLLDTCGNSAVACCPTSGGNPSQNGAINIIAIDAQCNVIQV